MKRKYTQAYKKTGISNLPNDASRLQWREFSQITPQMIRDTIMKDYQVKAKINMRIANALDFESSIIQGEATDEAYTYVQNMLKTNQKVNEKRLITLLLTAIWYGRAPISVLWGNEEIKDLQLMSPTDFALGDNRNALDAVFDIFGNKYPTNYLEFSNPCNFLFYPNEWYESELAPLYNLCAFRKRIVELWDRAFDKTSVPSVIAMLQDDVQQPEGYTLQEYLDELSENLEGIRSGAGVVLSGLRDIIKLDTSVNSGAFSSALSYIDEAIALVILGSSRTTDAQTKGSYASDKTSESAIYRLAKSDNKILETFLNILIAWQVWVKFGYDEAVPTWRYNRDEKASLEQMNQAITLGISVSKEAYYAQIPQPKSYDDILIVEKPQVSKFSELPKLKIGGKNDD